MSAPFYSTNALYNYLLQNPHPEFQFAKGNLWLMVYGTQDSIPKLLLVISALSDQEYDQGQLLPREAEILDLAALLAQRSGLPCRAVRYCKDRPLDQVQYLDCSGQQSCLIPIQRLPRLFRDCGLIPAPAPAGTSKPVNDRTSSAFHQWQRAVLGNEITASDIDLVRRRPSGSLTLYELKRSYRPLTEWTPYRQDFPNYRLLQRLSQLAGVPFQILYNRRTKDPYFDDIRRLTRFTFSLEEDQAHYLDTVSLGEFLAEPADPL